MLQCLSPVAIRSSPIGPKTQSAQHGFSCRRVHCTFLYTLDPTYATYPTIQKRALLHRILLQYRLEAKRLKRHTITNEMLTHGLNPVQTQRVQHSTCALHDTENHNGEREPEAEDEDHEDGANNAGVGEGVLHSHFPEHDGQTLMGEGQGPETKIGGCVGDAVETEFWGLLIVVVVVRKDV